MRLEGRSDVWAPRWIDDPYEGLRLLAQGEPKPKLSAIISARDLTTLRIIAIVAASFSILSGLVVGWWFVRMKRSFRHHLIMLLIFSDFFKASWQLIYPSVVLSRGGGIRSGSTFCNASGFLMSMGIEASDFAVLAIAVHSALYIFRPGMGGIGEGGLFRYRYYVYTGWLVFATLLPALAFVNSNHAYTTQATMCYLPVRHYWYRLALAWIPRYTIILLIMILYASIYIYVHRKFRTFRTSVGKEAVDLDSIDIAHAGIGAEKQRNPPGFPTLDAHGLIPPSPALRPEHSSRNSFPRSFLAPLVDKTRSSNSSDTGHESRRGSIPTIHNGHLPPPLLSPPTPEMSLADKESVSKPTASEEHDIRRVNISRQLRLLFIYPLVYAAMWIPPLVSHALQFTDYFAENPAFPLQCVVAFTLPFQCAVDCWLFTIRERPWTYIPEATHGGWISRYGFWGGKAKGRSCEVGAEEGEVTGWRHRKHMSYEARKAYERREEELREARMSMAQSTPNSQPRSPRSGNKRERSWWDAAEEHVLSSEFGTDDGSEDLEEGLGLGRRRRSDEGSIGEMEHLDLARTASSSSTSSTTLSAEVSGAHNHQMFSVPAMGLIAPTPPPPQPPSSGPWNNSGRGR